MFTLKLNDFSISSPDLILSDREKSIIAFCYYLANIHTLVSNDLDYDKIFLIIDAPVASMDFQYVYETAQIIREIPPIFKVDNFKENNYL